MKEHKPSNVLNLASPTANMFGIEPCPKCASPYRCPMKRDGHIVIECADCDFDEPQQEPTP